MLGADAVDDRLTFARCRVTGNRQAAAVRRFEPEAGILDDLSVQEVHRWRADEAGYEEVARLVVEVERRPHLFHLAVVHHHDLVGHGHGLDLVVGHVDGRRAEPLMQLFDLGTHGDAQLSVEVRQRLVEEEDLRVAHNGSAHGDALALAAGELARIASKELGQAENLRRLVDAFFDEALLGAPELQREAHVVGDRHVRIERVVLEHHGDVALFRRHVVDHALANHDVASGYLLQPGDHAKKRRLPAARRADENDEFAVGDINVYAVNDFNRAEGLTDFAQCHRCHWSLVPHSLFAAQMRAPDQPRPFAE